ncbi:MAG TPA: type III-B CRISPR module RAMP protein Cmr6 [Vicinamibacterales bacterium]|nr:type III-B CRISPR module RAMP protein Cmr6 [Vicinamibacterales bacterium]
MRAAAPRYIGSAFGTAPPGHRFRLYFRGWTDDDQWTFVKLKKKDMVKAAASAEQSQCSQLARELSARQLQLALAAGERTLVVEGRSTAPLVTGVGSEHPLENGFAFLDPYGVPYLPGSAIKGVVRRAAEELTLFDSHSGWDLLALWWLFGFDMKSGFVGAISSRGTTSAPGHLGEVQRQWGEAYREACERLAPDAAADWLRAAAASELEEQWQKDPIAFLRSFADADAKTAVRRLHLSGSLRFWDAIVRPPHGDLRVDIMNPHHQKYYQLGGSGSFEAPGDFRNPNPIFFLSVPPGALLTFIVLFAPVAAVPSSLRAGGWQALLRAAFAHGFTYLGFGAKTAVGYGLLEEVDTKAAPAAAGTPGPAVAPPAPSPAPKTVLAQLLFELKALAPAKVAGSIDHFVQRALELQKPEDRREAARAIVEKVTLKEARKKAKNKPQWQQILELAGM